MANNNLPITNFINISLSSTPQGLSANNVNSLLFLTTEIPTNLDPYRIYLSPKEVLNDYGSASEAYRMAVSVFSQSQNVLSGDGRLVVAPFVDSISGSSGSFSTDDISANLATLTAVIDGDIRVTVDGVNTDLTDLNLSVTTTLAEIATIFQAKLPNVVVSSDNTKINFSSKKVGVVSEVTLVTLPGGAGTDLSVVGLLDTAAGISDTGSDSSGETIVEAVTRLSDQVKFTGIITDLEVEDAVLLATATSIQTKDNIFIHSISSLADVAGIATDITTAQLTHTRILLYTPSIYSAQAARAAYAGRLFSVNFNASNSTITMNGKNLAGILSDTEINQTIIAQADTAGVDVYGSFGGLALLLTSGSNNYSDAVYNDLALKGDLEVAGFNALIKLRTKLPQTEQGMEVLLGAYINVCEKFINNRSLAAGLTWNSPETFGNQADFLRNITDKGYYIYYLPVAQQLQVDRDERKAPVIQIAVKSAGAIHSSDAIVFVEA